MASAVNNDEKEMELFALFQSHADGIIDDEEMFLLLNQQESNSSNPVFPYWRYPSFDISIMTEDECNAEFRFKKHDIERLCIALAMPDVVETVNRLVVPAPEALCILLRRLAYPCRYNDMIPRFGRSVPDLSVIFNHMVRFMYDNFGHLLSSFDQRWLQQDKLASYADVIYAKSGALQNCWGFIDGTVRACCRPGINQRSFYNGHKRFHGLKFQSVVCPNGLIANLYGPVEGKRHDSSLLAESGLLEKLEMFSFAPDGTPLCIYGDPAYPLRTHLQTGFTGAQLTADEERFNQKMSSVRVSVEWVFGDIIRHFAFVDFKKNLKVSLSPIGKMYVVSAILQNVHTCLYGSTTSTFFGLDPPSLEDYITSHK